jgi:hypothetical protein
MTARFLIELPHGATGLECARAIEILLKTGSHYFTHADWGCQDGVHKGWIIVEVESKEEARAIVPPAFRSQATIVQLNNYTIQEIESALRQHKP